MKKSKIYTMPFGPMVHQKEMRCSHCNRVNRLDIGKAALMMEHVVVVGVESQMFHTHEEPLSGLRADMYQHPLDRSSLSALRSIPELHRFKRIMGRSVKNRCDIRFSHQAFSVAKISFQSSIHSSSKRVHVLVLRSTPTLFLSQSPVINASTFGAEEPVIVVHSALLDHLDDAGVTTDWAMNWVMCTVSTPPLNCWLLCSCMEE